MIRRMPRGGWLRHPARIAAVVTAGTLAAGVSTAVVNAPAQAASEPVIGVSVYDMSGFETSSKPGMEAEAAALGVKLEWDSANLDVTTQVTQLRTFVSEHVAAIILDPINATSGDSVVPLINAAHIPLVLTNTALFKPGSNPDPTTLAATIGTEPGVASYEGPNDFGAGYNEMMALGKAMHGKGNIVELQGPLGQTPELMRTAGIAAALRKFPGIHLLTAQTANWVRDQAYTVMSGFWSAFGTKINGVVAENDDMAIGANSVLAAKGEEFKIPVVGIDGIQNGMQAVASGAEVESNLQDGMVEQGEAVWVADRIINHQSYPKYAVYNMVPLYKSNVQKYYNQMFKNLPRFLKQLPSIIAHDMTTGQYSAQ
jgi:ribose transport system substrate-binding protein